MDRMIYVAMTGAKHLLAQHAATSHNLANATTTGYRADSVAFRAVYVVGDGSPTRAFVVASTPGADFAPGPIQETGRDLDVAVQGKGWIAVQLADGTEAYTRSGSLQVSANGLLQTRAGHNVLGDGGPIAVPENTRIAIARDGTVSSVPNGLKPNAVNSLGRIKLANPEEARLVKGGDGLFRLKDGGAADADPKVGLVAGALEGSNVNVVEAMVDMIAIARGFEMHMKLLQSAENNARQAAQVLAVNR